MSDYRATIGLEIHAELKTATKMFCGSKNEPHESEPNSHVCPICMGHPGTLPTINREAVKHVCMVGLAIEGRLATYTEFDRKNYFYPDIPKGYQISQYAYPLVTGGSLAGVAITRIHLEEDTARSLHDKTTGSLIDYNRAGVPLMELVTEPVIHDAETAGKFARELQLLLRTLGVSDANMERGEMRVEANISVSPTDALGTKVEVKNLNSFRSVESAIAYEVKRQIAHIKEGGTVQQETRGWDEVKEVTVPQRKKESSHDYRYFPDPDLPKLNIGEIDELSVSRLSEIMPEIPSNKRIRYRDLGIPENSAEVLIANLSLGAFYDTTIGILAARKTEMNNEERKKVANYVTSDIMGLIAEHEHMVIENASAEAFAGLMELLFDGKINSRVAKDLLGEVVFEGKDAALLADERGVRQKGSVEDLMPLIDTVLEEHATVAAEYQSGKEAALQFLIGQGMKASRGAANPGLLKELFISRLKEDK